MIEIMILSPIILALWMVVVGLFILSAAITWSLIEIIMQEKSND